MGIHLGPLTDDMNERRAELRRLVALARQHCVAAWQESASWVQSAATVPKSYPATEIRGIC
jgi:hypothetical protein